MSAVLQESSPAGNCIKLLLYPRGGVKRSWQLGHVTCCPELRKYGVGFTVAHQYLSQLEPDVRDTVLGNAETITTFRLGAEG